MGRKVFPCLEEFRRRNIAFLGSGAFGFPREEYESPSFVNTMACAGNDSIKIDIQVAHEVFVSRKPAGGWGIGSFENGNRPNINLPFDKMWMEFTSYVEIPTRPGEMVSVPAFCAFRKLENNEFTISAGVFAQSDLSGSIEGPFHPVLYMDQFGWGGEYKHDGSFSMGDPESFLSQGDRGPSAEMEYLREDFRSECPLFFPEFLNNFEAFNLIQIAEIAITAIGLMNCKNVRLENGIDRGRMRKTSSGRKNREPSVKFKTIQIDGVHRDPFDHVPVGPAFNPLHYVRGHFKTFTSERPMFGKLVGTYWWGWQVRGDSANGINVNDYELSPSLTNTKEA